MNSTGYTQQIEIYRKLREEILSGNIEKGKKITEKEIAEMLGVKRGLLLTRGLLGVTALTLFFISVKSTTLSNAVGLFHTYPLFTTLIGVLFFKERQLMFQYF